METILNTLLGVILGGALGYLTSTYFHKKGVLFEKHMYNISHSIEEVYLNTKFPSIFVSQNSVISNYHDQRPSNKDIPHLSKVCTETNKIVAGDELFVLFRMIDEGMNLPLQSGVRVVNSLNRYNTPIGFEGFGWCSCRIKIPTDAPTGAQKLIFEFEDSVGNRNKQEYLYQVTDGR